jgi:excisionase family DNA binding protein
MTGDGVLLSVTEAAELCHLKASTIRRWILNRRLPFVKLGRRVLLRRNDIEALIERNVVPARADPHQPEVVE